jgi:predicted DNA-binding helix-hairpin-helix protein
VAGGADESDLELLTTTEWLHKNVRLGRAYFSAFSPIRDTPLENKAAVDPLREHRLYQASFLLRDYGFDLEELPFSDDGNLPLPTDPKLAWAQKNLSERPLEINRADKRELMRIPGAARGPSAGVVQFTQTGNRGPARGPICFGGRASQSGANPDVLSAEQGPKAVVEAQDAGQI